MKNKKKTVTIIAIIGIGLAIIGGIGFYTCYHTWNAATCTRPRTCSICGKQKEKAKAIPGVMQPVLNHRHVPCVSRQKVRRWDTILIAGPR